MMNCKQIKQEITLNLDNQLPEDTEQRLHLVIGFLYGGAFEEMYWELCLQKVTNENNGK